MKRNKWMYGSGCTSRKLGYYLCICEEAVVGSFLKNTVYYGRTYKDTQGRECVEVLEDSDGEANAWTPKHFKYLGNTSALKALYGKNNTTDSK